MTILMENKSNTAISEKMMELLKMVIQISLQHEKYPENVEVSITFVDNKEIQQLNNQYRNIDKATDVLSFPMLEFELEDNTIEELDLDGLEEYMNPDTNELMLGDIIISIQKAIEQAKEYGHSLERELGFLTAHSMFHLMGYDHMTLDEEKKMMEKQEKVLQEAGLDR